MGRDSPVPISELYIIGTDDSCLRNLKLAPKKFWWGPMVKFCAFSSECSPTEGGVVTVQVQLTIRAWLG